MLATNVSAGTDSENNLSKKNSVEVKDCFEGLNRATFSLNQGDILRIAIGQMGESYVSGNNGGGGGGTFVAKGSDHSGATALIITW